MTVANVITKPEPGRANPEVDFGEKHALETGAADICRQERRRLEGA